MADVEVVLGWQVTTLLVAAATLVLRSICSSSSPKDSSHSDTGVIQGVSEAAQSRVLSGNVPAAATVEQGDSARSGRRQSVLLIGIDGTHIPP